MQDRLEVGRLEVLELLRAGKGELSLGQGKVMDGTEERMVDLTLSAEKNLSFSIRALTLLAMSSTRRQAWSVSIASSMFCPTRRASSNAFFCAAHDKTLGQLRGCSSNRAVWPAASFGPRLCEAHLVRHSASTLLNILVKLDHAVLERHCALPNFEQRRH